MWFDKNAEEAMNFYTSVFADGKIISINRYADGPMKDKVLTAVFELAGQQFMAIDGGPTFKFTEAISFQVWCETQEEVDRYWEKLSAVPAAEQCGWLKDKYGLSWQITPKDLPALLSDPDPIKAKKAFDAMMKMKKIDIEALKQVKEA